MSAKMIFFEKPGTVGPGPSGFEVHAYDANSADDAPFIAAAKSAGWPALSSWTGSSMVAKLPQLAQQQLDWFTGPRGPVMRCFIAGKTVPSSYVQYRLALVAIVNGSDTSSTALPAAPSFVAGT